MGLFKISFSTFWQFDWPSQNLLKLILRNSRFVTFGPIWPTKFRCQICHPCTSVCSSDDVLAVTCSLDWTPWPGHRWPWFDQWPVIESPPDDQWVTDGQQTFAALVSGPAGANWEVYLCLMRHLFLSHWDRWRCSDSLVTLETDESQTDLPHTPDPFCTQGYRI